MIVTRFAPSPTGYLHLGHAYSAILNHDLAKAHDGRFLLRIEDIDTGRCRPEYEDAVLEDVSWLGLSWQEPVLRQSERLPAYRQAIDDLVARGLVYRCFLTRKEVAESLSAPHGAPEGVFTGAPLPAAEEAARLDRGDAYAWRLSQAAAAEALGEGYAGLAFPLWEGDRIVAVPAEPQRHGDVVLARKDTGTSYHLCATLDDADQGVTHIVRGEDLASAAGLHRLLLALFGRPCPAYRHHPLVTDETGRRLAKRDRSVTLRALRESGVTPDRIRARLGLEEAPAPPPEDGPPAGG